MRKRESSFACRWHVLCWLIVPLSCAIQHDARHYRTGKTYNFITEIPRGGDGNERPINESDEDDDERTRFWSLSALFRLNANAKDDASSSSAASHLQRGNKRGGALAVRTSQSKTFVDVTPVSTASSRLVDDQASDTDMNIEDRVGDEELIQSSTFDSIKEPEMIEEGGSEEVGSSQEESEEEVAIAEEESRHERGADAAQISTEPSQSVEDDEEYVSDIEDQDESHIVVEEVTGIEILHKIKETDAVDPDRQATQIEIDDTEADGMVSEAEESSTHAPDRTHSMLQDASKYWWNNVWTEQTSDEIPELDSLVSDDESDGNVSLPDELATTERLGDRMQPLNQYDVSDVEVKEVELEGEEAQQQTVEEEPSLEDSTRHQTDGVATEESKMIDIDPSEVQLSAEKPSELVSDVGSPANPRQPHESAFISSGYWGTIDKMVSLGLSDVNPSWKLSRHLRSVRKATARATGLHGFISQKRKALVSLPENALRPPTSDDATLGDDDLGMIQRRIAAIEIAKQNVAKRAAEKADTGTRNRRGLFGRRRRRLNQADDVDVSVTAESLDMDESEVFLTLERMSLEEQIEDQRRRERVKEIDGLISKGQKALVDLQCEKDDLQRRPNPLYNYTTTDDGKTERSFNFPHQELVDEYLEELFANGRLEKMNHTHLWQNGAEFDDDEDESIGDDLFVPSADARKLYERELRDRPASRGSESKSSNGNGGGGSWLLRQNLGKGGSLGEKIGETTETAAYKAICAAVMSSLARSIAAIHGVNIMTHSDIRLYMEQSPDLPPLGKNVIPGSDGAHNYAQEAIMDAMRKGVTKRRKRGSRSRRLRVEEAFLQRDAVVETLLSHCQISAPLLKLFPLSWQRALLGNIITLIATVVSDFCDGIQLQILGHQLSFSFKPITESDMIRHIGMAGNSFNHRRARPEQFEAAIRATADDVSENLQFLDRWHHRALGSGMLRAQIANLIARIVLTLADEVLSGARFDLWSAQAGGPRMLAGLEYRVSPGLNDEI